MTTGRSSLPRGAMPLRGENRATLAPPCVAGLGSAFEAGAFELPHALRRPSSEVEGTGRCGISRTLIEELVAERRAIARPVVVDCERRAPPCQPPRRLVNRTGCADRLL